MFDRYIFRPDSDFYQRFNVYHRLESLPVVPEVYPNQIIPVITHENLNFVWLMKWGMIPFWAKNKGIGNRMFTLPYDSVSLKPAFRNSFKNHRCLVPANGFYVSKINMGQEKSYLLKLANHPIFSFTGIFDIWQEPVSGREIYSFSIITVPANTTVRPVSDQMPVILSPSSERDWLNPSTPMSQIHSLLKSTSEPLILSESNLKKYYNKK